MMRFLTAAALLLVLYTAATARTPALPVLAHATIERAQGKPISFTLEVSATPEQRALGLMHRKHIGQFQGMLFLFPKARDYEFWMSYTYIPLDMLFLDADSRIAHIEANAEPESLRPRSANQLIHSVIELPGGTTHAENIAVGDHVSIVLSQPVDVR